MGANAVAIEDLKKRIRILELEEKGTATQVIAMILHKKECHQNHVNGCPWDYEKWGGATKAAFLKRAQAMLNGADFQTVLQVLDGFYGETVTL